MCSYTNVNLTRTAYPDLAVTLNLTTTDSNGITTYDRVVPSGPYTMPDVVVRPPLMASPSYAPLAKSPFSEYAQAVGLQSVFLTLAPLHPSGAFNPAVAAGDAPAHGLLSPDNSPLISFMGVVLLGMIIGATLATSKPWGAVPVAFLHGVTKIVQSILHSLQVLFTFCVPLYYAAQHVGACDPALNVSPAIILICTSLFAAFIFFLIPLAVSCSICIHVHLSFPTCSIVQCS